MLLDHGLSPYDEHEDSYFPLHRACWGNTERHTNFVKVMLDAGVPHDLKAGNGKICRDLTRNEKTIKLLEEYAAKGTKNHEGLEEL
jgi:hypothetical protein